MNLDTLASMPVDAPETLSTMYVVSSTLAFGAAADQTYRFDGQRWRTDFLLPGGGGGVTFFFGLGPRVGMVANENTLYLRDSEGAWNALPPVVEGFGSLRRAVFLNHDRIIGAGNGGFTSGWTGEQWCDIYTGVQRAARAMVAAPSGDGALIGSFGETATELALLVRIDVNEQP